MKLHIAYTVSDEFTHFLSVSMASILKNSNLADEFIFYILGSDITPENKRKIESLKSIKNFDIEWITVHDKDFKDTKAGVNMASNYRIRISSLKPDLDKILFLDADMIITSSLAELYSLDLKNNYIAAVVDPGVKLQYEYTIKHKEKFPDRRFNTGLMLINLEKWRLDNIEQKLLEGMKWYSKYYYMWPDQNVMNMVFKDYILELPAKYNCCPLLAQRGYYQQEGLEEEALQNPIVIHFCGTPKPWECFDIRTCKEFNTFQNKVSINHNLLWDDIFWTYAKLTPYYEAFIAKYIDYRLKETQISAEMVKNIVNYKQNKFKYWQYKLLCNFVFGKTRDKYFEKKKLYKEKLNCAKEFI